MAKTLWEDTLLDIQVGSGGQTQQTLVASFSNEEMRLAGLTLLRTIIGLHVAHLVHDSGEGSQKVSLAIGIAEQDSFATAALPDPQNSSDRPVRGWIWRAQYVTYGFAADQAAVFDNRIDKDVRSRRKLDNGECYIIVANDPDQGSTGTIGVIGLVRQLWLIT